MSWMLLIYLPAILLIAFASSVDDEQFLREKIREVQTDLARSFFRKLSKRDAKIENVAWNVPWEDSLLENSSNPVVPFEAFGKSLILSSNAVLEVKSEFPPHVVGSAPALLPHLHDHVSFVKAIEWRRILFIVLANKNGHCRLFTAGPNLEFSLRQTIHNSGLAQDGTFFTMNQDDLYLFLAIRKHDNSPTSSYLYRWTGTHFDEIDSVMTTGAIAVRTFYTKSSFYVIIAQHIHSNPMVGSQVLKLERGKLQRMQFLPTRGPLSLQMFSVKQEQYLLVLSDNNEPGSTYWWSGTEFLAWESLPNITGKYETLTTVAHGSMLVLMAQHDLITIYQPNELYFRSLLSVRLLEVDEILKISMHPTTPGILIALARKQNKIYLKMIKLSFPKISSDGKTTVEDPLLQCLNKLEKKLEEDKINTNYVKMLSDNLILTNEAVNFKGKLSVTDLKSRDLATKTLLIHPSKDHELVSTSTELKHSFNKLESSLDSAEISLSDVVFYSKSSVISGDLLVEEDLIINNAFAEDFFTSIVNGKSFDDERLEHEQNLDNATNHIFDTLITSSVVIVDHLNTMAINDKKVDDLLTTEGNQVIKGKTVVSNLITHSAALSDRTKALVNDLSQTQSREAQLGVSRNKIKNLNENNLTVDYLNESHVTDSKKEPKILFRQSDSTFRIDDHSFDTEVTISDLHATFINDIKWDDFISSLFLLGTKQSFEDHVTFISEVDVGELVVPSINHIASDNFMTKSTDQSIDSMIEADSIIARDVKTSNINGLELSVDAVLLVGDSYISGLVIMQDMQVNGNISMDQGGCVDETRFDKQVQIYTGNVLINGSIQAEDIDFGTSTVTIGGKQSQYPEILSQYWKKSVEQSIHADVTFEMPLTIEGDLEVDILNSNSVNDLLHLQSPQIEGNIIFDYVHVLGDVTSEPGVTVSGIDLQMLNEEVVKQTGTYVIHGAKVFSGSLEVESLQCQYLNDYKTSSIVTLSGDSTLQGTKYFDEVIIKEDVAVDGPVNTNQFNGENLPEKLQSIIRIDQPTYIQNVTFQNLKTKNLQVKYLNGVNLNTMHSIFEHVNSSLKKVYVKGDVIFEDALTVDSLNSLHINNYLSKVMSKSQGGEVSGKTNVHGEVHLEFLESALLNGVNIQDLAQRSLSKTRNQIITGHYTVKSARTENLKADQILGIKMEELIYTDTLATQVFRGNVTFHDANFHDLYVVYFNDCYLPKAYETIFNLKGKKYFDAVHIEDSLYWEISVPNHKLLSHLYNNAVSLHHDQNITGEVIFQRSTFSNYVTSKLHINDIDMDFIVNDALIKYAEKQVVFGRKVFATSLSSVNAYVNGQAFIKAVNGIDVLMFNQTLVRGYEDRLVRGHKYFLNGFNAESFTCEGKFNGVFPSEIVTYDSPILPTAHFEQLEIITDLNVETVNSVDLNKFIYDRVTLDGKQSINSTISFAGMVECSGDAGFKRINDVIMSDVLLTKADKMQYMTGSKAFNMQLIILGDMDVGFIDGYNLSHIYSQALQFNENATIYGNVIFSNDVAMGNNLDVKYLVNGVDVESLPQQLQQDAISNLHNIQLYREQIGSSIRKSQEKTAGMAHEFMYLEEDKSMQVNLSNSVHVRTIHLSGSTVMNAYSWDEASSSCGLPTGCLCPRQQSVVITPRGDSDGYAAPHASLLTRSERHFYITDNYKTKNNSEFVVKVSTNTVSMNSRCSLPTTDNIQEGSSMVWSIPSADARQFNEVGGAPQVTVAGYLSDARGFKIGTYTYVILGLYYDNSIDSHNMDSVVYKMKLRENQPKLVQKLPTRGVRALEVFHTHKSVHLVVGNSYDSKMKQADVEVDIYRFDARRDKFNLLRSYPTSGAIAIKSIVLGSENFIIIAQRFKAPVIILKFYQDNDNYFFFQEIIFQAPVLDLGVFYVGDDDAFLIVAVENGMFYIYKYAYIEGFKLILSQVHKDILAVTPFSVANKQYIFVSSKFSTRVLRIVTQGPR